MSPHQLDLLALILSCVAGILVSLSWVHLSSQTRVLKSPRSSAGIALRVTILYGVIWSLACYGMNCPARIMGAATTCVICLSLFVDSDSVVSGDVIGYAVGMTLLCPILITKLFVFGFVDDEELRLPAPPPAVRPFVGVPVGTQVTVVAPLKSLGTIEFNGDQYNAISQDGSYIPSGTPVVVCGERQGTLLIRCLTNTDITS